MRLKNIKKNLVISLLAFATFIQAEPSKTIRYLMNEPLSMFDWGMYRLDEYLSDSMFSSLDLIKYHSNIEYDWDRNLIKIKYTIYPRYSSLRKTPPKEICEYAMNMTRRLLREDENSPFPREGISRFFKHTGFNNTGKPKNFIQEVENSTTIIVSIYSSATDRAMFNHEISCEGPLTSDKVLFSKESIF